MGVEPPPEDQTQPESGGRHLGGKPYTHTQTTVDTGGKSIGLFLAMLAMWLEGWQCRSVHHFVVTAIGWIPMK